MKVRKIFIASIIINFLLIGVVYNFIKKDYLNNEKIIVKAMTEGEYEANITSLNTSHEDYANYIEESKKQIASAITDMGVITSNDATAETMASNIRSITGVESADKVSYDNTNSTLAATNVQGAVDELNDSLSNLKSVYSRKPENYNSYCTTSYKTFPCPKTGWYFMNISTNGDNTEPAFLRFGIVGGYLYSAHGRVGAYSYLTSPLIYIEEGTEMIAQYENVHSVNLNYMGE